MSERVGVEANAAPVLNRTQSIDRRRSRRVKLSVPARIRPYYQTGGASEELLSATNLSRDGFYFVSQQPTYRENMNLYVACPAGHSRTLADAECARVVRVDFLSEGSWGVAVAFLHSAFCYHNDFSSQRSNA